MNGSHRFQRALKCGILDMGWTMLGMQLHKTILHLINAFLVRTSSRILSRIQVVSKTGSTANGAASGFGHHRGSRGTGQGIMMFIEIFGPNSRIAGDRIGGGQVRLVPLQPRDTDGRARQVTRCIRHQWHKLGRPTGRFCRLKGTERQVCGGNCYFHRCIHRKTNVGQRDRGNHRTVVKPIKGCHGWILFLRPT